MDYRCHQINAFMQRENVFQSSPQTQSAGLLAVCRMCPFSEELDSVPVLNRGESFAWWRRRAPRLCHLTRLLLEGGGSVYKQ